MKLVRIVSGYGLFFMLWFTADRIWTFHSEARPLAVIMWVVAYLVALNAWYLVFESVQDWKTAKIEAEMEAAKRQFQLEAEQHATYAAADDLSRPIEDVIRDAEKRAAQ